ncbi:MAG: hypothetical protein AB8B73_08690 [Ekhidna sp.]
MAKGFKTWNDFHHQINQIYHLCIAVSLIPFALLFLEIDSSKSFSIDNGALTVILLVLVNSVIGFLSWYAWKGKITQYIVNEEMPLRDKLKEYMERNTWRFGFLLMASLISLAGLWIISSYLFVLSYFAVLVQYSLMRPSQDKVTRDVRLTKKDREIFMGGEVQ